jgi:hypothetical protein
MVEAMVKLVPGQRQVPQCRAAGGGGLLEGPPASGVGETNLKRGFAEWQARRSENAVRRVNS